ncbi:MAG TPA: VTT domain-containing protein [Solirubrobacterales bacterium]|nr:VTT domain-containing protein [Solirubrobacterales bacterium]
MDYVAHMLSSLPLALGPSWLDPETLIEKFSMIGLLVIVFMESGLMVGFFLPGDSLLFTAGLLSSTTDLLPDIWVLVILIPIAAIAGDQCGYWIGRKFGPPLFNRPDSRFFKREFVDQTSAFFEKHGARAIILARFVPIVRAFVPVMAGTSKMNYRTFLTFDIIGGILWGAGVTTLGYFLGQIQFVQDYIEFILLGVVAISVIPVVLELNKARKAASTHQKPEPFETPIDEEGEPIHPEADEARDPS